MSTVIKVENISKQYRLGDVGTGALAHDVNKWWHKVRGKENPYLKIGETNDRSLKGESDYVWALKDINFEVKQGEVLGIIGRNGAGKSTLLKILSKTTTPTTGTIKIKGRIASLLEVGTGFHPELSGRDNIFLNGAILGMTKREIKSKFDEIVDFAGVERYIDTPVKRYSSGMYVRLAFGVAAHLEPDILIVDEVLAVGDAEFQKKALGKMKDVSGKDGRTVLFVSHNMASIENLCKNVLVMEQGNVVLNHDTASSLKYYYRSNEKIYTDDIAQRTDREGDRIIMLSGISADDALITGGEVKFTLKIIANSNISKPGIAIKVSDDKGLLLFTLYNRHSENNCKLKDGMNEIHCIVNEIPLNAGTYTVGVWLSSNAVDTSDQIDGVLSIEINNGNFYGSGYLPSAKIHGPIALKSEWENY